MQTSTIAQSYALTAEGFIWWSGAAASPAEAIRALILDVGHHDYTRDEIASMSEDDLLRRFGWLDARQITEQGAHMLDMLAGDDPEAIRIVEQYTISTLRRNTALTLATAKTTTNAARLAIDISTIKLPY